MLMYSILCIIILHICIHTYVDRLYDVVATVMFTNVPFPVSFCDLFHYGFVIKSLFIEPTASPIKRNAFITFKWFECMKELKILHFASRFVNSK